MIRYLKIAWVCLAGLVALFGLTAGGDASILAIYVLGALTLPLGLGVYVLGSLMLMMLNKTDPNFGVIFETAINIIMYSVTIAAGYFQWFVAVPKLVSKIRHKKQNPEYVELSLRKMDKISEKKES